MSYFENKCQNCGATIIKGDNRCRTCSTPLANMPIPKEEMINSVKKSDLRLFIDKNSLRYVEIFSRNENKKVFFNMNWAAMFFNVYWMFYRKMYKYAVIYLIVSILFSIGLTAVVSAAVRPAMLEAQQIIEPYSQYLDKNNGLYAAYSDGSVDVSVILEAATEYDKEIKSITGKLGFWVAFPTIIFNVVFGLLADCIYRRYVLRNIEYKSGGTSGWSLVGGVIIFIIVENIILSPIVTYVAENILK